MDTFIKKGVLLKIDSREKYGAKITISGGKIEAIEKDPSITEPYILPGFVDSHVHIESSMLVPSQFARLAVRHGTVAVVTDPHEVANVAGEEGVRFMVENSKTVPVKFFFGVPSCVPASPMEKSGAVLTANDVERMMSEQDFFFLAEMMNFPGVLRSDPEVMQKLHAAKNNNKPTDGHAPGLSGDSLTKYVDAGISTDHECSNEHEAEEKISLGQKIQIREGSAARNFESLSPLLDKRSQSVMFCTDDCHPDYLVEGHINKVVSRAVAKGYDLFNVLSVATANPVHHYGLPVGQLNIGDCADFIIVDDLINFNVKETYIDGVKVYGDSNVLFNLPNINEPNYVFRTEYPTQDMLKVISVGNNMNVIEVIPGELLTKWLVQQVKKNEQVNANTESDLLKIVLLDRYSNTPPVVAFIKGFGLKQGAIAESIAHDSHHIVAVGTDDKLIIEALKWIVVNRGGLCFANSDSVFGIQLPFFGLMTNQHGENVSKQYEEINKRVKDAGCSIQSPFMTASFMALTVIPNLKINHNGLFDVNKFCSVPLFH